MRRFVNYKPLSALEVDEINRNTPDLTPEEQAIHDALVIEECIHA